MSVPEPSKARPAPKETAPLDAADTWTQDRAVDSGAEQQGTHKAQFCLHPSHGWLSPQAKELLTVSPPRPFAWGHVATGLTPAVTRFFKTQGLSARPVPESGA